MVRTLQAIGIRFKLFIGITDCDQFCSGQYYSICADVKTKCVLFNNSFVSLSVQTLNYYVLY